MKVIRCNVTVGQFCHPISVIILFFPPLSKGNDVMTATQLQEAIESYDGLKGCSSTVIETNLEKQNSATVKWSGISQFNNFQYNEDESITVWKSFDIVVKVRK